MVGRVFTVDRIADLTNRELDEVCGTVTVARGLAYAKHGRVVDLDLSDDELASVQVQLPFLPAPIDVAASAGFRLSEATLHGWDVFAAFDRDEVLAPDAAAFSGVPVDRLRFRAALVSGGIAGLGGATQVMGVQHQLTQGISNGYGYTGIIVATLGGLTALGVVLVAVLLGAAFVGEQISATTLVGGAITVAAVALVIKEESRRSAGAPVADPAPDCPRAAR